MPDKRFENEFVDLDAETPGSIIESGEPLTQKLLQQLHLNDYIIHKEKTDALMRNVRAKLDRDGRNVDRKVPHKRDIAHELCMWSDIDSFAFGSPVYIGQGETRPSWTDKIYDFPTNDDGNYFHADYLPVVIIQLLNTPGLRLPRMTVTQERVRTTGFRFSVHQLEAGTAVAGADRFWLSILAIGRKGDFWG